MTAKLRHTLRGGRVQLTVTPNDGRYPETFITSQAEARRFAWAMLADLAPLEALEAAAEEGRPLADLIATVEIPRFTRKPPHRPERAAAGKLGEKSQRVLRAVVAGARSTADIRSRCPGVADASALLCTLRDLGFVARVDGGGQGHPATWAPTAAGKALLAAEGAAA